MINCGGDHSIVLKNNGTVWTWGFNQYGQLGDGSTNNRSAPYPVDTLKNVTSIASGGDHTVVLKSDGTVWAWGSNNSGQLGDGTTTNRNNPRGNFLLERNLKILLIRILQYRAT